MNVESIDLLIVGAGVSGLGTANFVRELAHARGLREPSILVVDREQEPGGYCRTVARDGFVWDYSGHFFHFRHRELDAWMRARMPDADIRTVHKKTRVRACGVELDFPFQKNLHQLPRDDLVACLSDLYVASRTDDAHAPSSFPEMLAQRFGRAISERFLLPYNEKLYACDLSILDPDAMGRFFPHASFDDVMNHMALAQRGGAVDTSYNATFTYPAGGAVEYVRALLRDLPPTMLALGEDIQRIDLAHRTVTTSKRTIRFRQLVSSIALPGLASLAGVAHDASAFSCNRVLVFNLGFDRKGRDDVHWMYFADRALPFYRVGFYDNIIAGPRMSLYVEVGLPSSSRGAPLDVDGIRAQVLEALAREGLVDGHRVIAEHHVVMDPAYVHITPAGRRETTRVRDELARHHVSSIGRYGAWTYCSIEDNLVEGKALAADLVQKLVAAP